MAYVVDVVGLESVMQRFELYGCKAFSVWQGKQLKFVCDEMDSMDDAAEFLNLNLQGIHPLSTALYEIRIYKEVPEKGIDQKTPIRGSFTFKMNTGLSDATAGNYNAGNNQVLDFYKQQTKTLQERLDNLEQKQLAGIGAADDDQEEDPQLRKISGIVDLIDSSPFLQKVATDMMGIFKNIFPGQQGNAQPMSAQISGIDISKDKPGQEKIQDVVAALIDASTPEESRRKLEVLAESLRLCYQRDPDFLNVLQKLGVLEQGKYNMAKSFL